MSEPVIFKDLPATFPDRDKFKKPSFVGSIVFHGLLIFAVVIIPFARAPRIYAATRSPTC